MKKEFEDVLRIIDLCRVVKKKGVDPFEVDVEKSLKKLKEYLPKWKVIDEFLADAEAIEELSRIIKLQSDWIVKRASTALDPLLIELKIRMLEKERLAQCLLESWHPIVQLQQISPQRLEEAIAYWNNLSDQDLSLPSPREEDFGEGAEALFSEDFAEEARKLMDELREKGRTKYMEFISAETFEETVKRGYLLSFLIADGHVSVEAKPLSEEIFIEPMEGNSDGEVKSLAISIEYEKWRRIRGNKKKIEEGS